MLEIYLGICNIPPLETDEEITLELVKDYMETVIGLSYDLKVCEAAGGIYSQLISEWVKFRPTEYD